MVNNALVRAAKIVKGIGGVISTPVKWPLLAATSPSIKNLPLTTADIDLGPNDPRNNPQQLDALFKDPEPGAPLTEFKLKGGSTLGKMAPKADFVAQLEQMQTDHTARFDALYSKIAGYMKTFSDDLGDKGIPTARVIQGLRANRDAALTKLDEHHATQQQDLERSINTLFESPDLKKALFGDLEKEQIIDKLRSTLKASQSKEANDLKSNYEKAIEKAVNIERQLLHSHLLANASIPQRAIVEKAAEERRTDKEKGKSMSVGVGEPEKPLEPSIADLEKLGDKITINGGATTADFGMISSRAERQAAISKQLLFHESQGFSGVKWTSEGSDSARKKIRRDQGLMSMLKYNEQNPNNPVTRGNAKNMQEGSPAADFNKKYRFDDGDLEMNDKFWKEYEDAAAKRGLTTYSGKQYTADFNDRVPPAAADETIELADGPKLSGL